MKKKYIVISVIILSSLLLIIGGVTLFLYKKITNPSNCNNEYCIYIGNGTTSEDVINTIALNGGEDFAYWVDKVFDIRNRRINRYEGFYKITPQMSVWDIYNLFALGDSSTSIITFNNIRTKKELAYAICKNINMPADTLYKALCDTATCSRYGFDTVTISTMFLPDSYEIFKSTSKDKFLNRMAKEYQQFWNKKRSDKAESIGLTPYEVIILASIVEEETKKVDEMAVVAGLYINRLKRGMLLQSDPTVKFATGDFGLKRILNKHLEIESPYNTYKYVGLPPGPIRIPSKIAIDKVLNYEKSNYLYMCAKEDFSGYHNFATTLSEHNRNAAKYRRELNRLKIK